MSDFAIQVRQIQAAAQRIRPYVIRTPCLHYERLSRELGCKLHLKLENLQHIGAFKARGAMNAVLELEDSQAGRGVVTHSSGNHAAALARAATMRGMPAHVVMPDNSVKKKIESVRAFGVEPIFCEPTAESRALTAEKIRVRTGATLVHPYNDPAVMSGQGTVGLEIIEDLPSVDTVLVPVGGGGLLSGMLTAIKATRPNVRVIAVEPELADDAYRSFQRGKIELPTRVDTIADGLRTPLGDLTFPIIQSWIDDFVLVSEAAIQRAMRFATERARLVVEPSGAVALAGILENLARFQNQTVVAVVSGGNLELGNCRLGQ